MKLPTVSIRRCWMKLTNLGGNGRYERTTSTNKLQSQINVTGLSHHSPRGISSTNGIDSIKNTQNDDTNNTDSISICDIIPGPALLRTSLSHRNRPQPSMLHLPGLRSLPFWSQLDRNSSNNSSTNSNSNYQTRIAYQDPEVTSVVRLLEENATHIVNEYNTISNKFPSDYQNDTEHSLHEGKWDWHSFMLKGKIQEHFVQNYSTTTTILQQLRNSNILFEGLPFGYCFFSTLHANSKIHPHTAPMNLRVRIHLSLIVPTEGDDDTTTTNTDRTKPLCGIRVGPMIRKWETGKAIVLDDSYEHEVWNNTNTNRVVLLVDIWHPDITQQERSDIVGMFQHAKDQGWWSPT